LHAAGSSILPGDPDFEPGEIPETGYPVEDTTTTFTSDWLIDFQRGMIRLHSEDVSFNVRNRAFRPFVRTEVFDGKHQIGHWPRDANTSKFFTPGESYADVTFWGSGEVPVSWTDIPVFYAHGLLDVVPQNLQSAGLEAADELSLQDDVMMIDGYACLELRLQRGQQSLRVYVAEALDWLPRRVEHYNVFGGMSTRVDIEYEETAEGWFPSSWRAVHFVGAPDATKDTILKDHRVTVARRELDLATRPEDFQVELKPGMVVNRRDLPEFEKQRVSSEGKLVPFSALIAPQPQVSNLRLILIVNAICIIAITAIFLRSRKKARAASQHHGDGD
jgi:hypothetical protein